MTSAPAPLENGRVNSASVIPNAKPKLLRIVRNFRFDVKALGMVQGIVQRLAPDAVGFLQNHGVQRAGAAFDDNLEGGFGAAWRFLGNLPKRRRQIADGVTAAEIADPAS